MDNLDNYENGLLPDKGKWFMHPVDESNWKNVFGRVFFLDDHGVFRPLDREKLLSGEMSNFEDMHGLPFNVGEILQQFTKLPLQQLHHYANLGEYLQALFIQRKLVDVIIHVQDKIFAAHRVALSCHSVYFARIFFVDQHQNNKLTEITLKNVESHTFYSALSFIYTGKLYINDSNVDGLLQLSNELQIPGLLFKCIDFLGRLPLAKSMVAETDEPTIEEQASDFLRIHIHDLTQHEAFLESKVDIIERVLGDDDIMAESELDVFYMAVTWLSYKNKAERRQHQDRLMRQVRFTCMTPVEVIESSQVNEMVRESSYCRNRVLESIWLMTLKAYGAADTLRCVCQKARSRHQSKLTGYSNGRNNLMSELSRDVKTVVVTNDQTPVAIDVKTLPDTECLHYRASRLPNYGNVEHSRIEKLNNHLATSDHGCNNRPHIENPFARCTDDTDHYASHECKGNAQYDFQNESNMVSVNMHHENKTGVSISICSKLIHPNDHQCDAFVFSMSSQGCKNGNQTSLDKIQNDAMAQHVESPVLENNVDIQNPNISVARCEKTTNAEENENVRPTNLEARDITCDRSGDKEKNNNYPSHFEMEIVPHTSAGSIDEDMTGTVDGVTDNIVSPHTLYVEQKDEPHSSVNNAISVEEIPDNNDASSTDTLQQINLEGNSDDILNNELNSIEQNLVESSNTYNVEDLEQNQVTGSSDNDFLITIAQENEGSTITDIGKDTATSEVTTVIENCDLSSSGSKDTEIRNKSPDDLVGDTNDADSIEDYSNVPMKKHSAEITENNEITLNAQEVMLNDTNIIGPNTESDDKSQSEDGTPSRNDTSGIDTKINNSAMNEEQSNDGNIDILTSNNHVDQNPSAKSTPATSLNSNIRLKIINRVSTSLDLSHDKFVPVDIDLPYNIQLNVSNHQFCYAKNASAKRFSNAAETKGKCHNRTTVRTVEKFCVGHALNDNYYKATMSTSNDDTFFSTTEIVRSPQHGHQTLEHCIHTSKIDRRTIRCHIGHVPLTIRGTELFFDCQQLHDKEDNSYCQENEENTLKTDRLKTTNETYRTEASAYRENECNTFNQCRRICRSNVVSRLDTQQQQEPHYVDLRSDLYCKDSRTLCSTGRQERSGLLTDQCFTHKIAFSSDSDHMSDRRCDGSTFTTGNDEGQHTPRLRVKHSLSTALSSPSQGAQPSIDMNKRTLDGRNQYTQVIGGVRESGLPSRQRWSERPGAELFTTLEETSFISPSPSFLSPSLKSCISLSSVCDDV